MKTDVVVEVVVDEVLEQAARDALQVPRHDREGGAIAVDGTNARGARSASNRHWKLLRQPSTGRVALEYWFLYLYNDFTDRHAADLEGVTVLDDGTPIGGTYSQHQGRSWVHGALLPPSRSGTTDLCRRRARGRR